MNKIECVKNANKRALNEIDALKQDVEQDSITVEKAVDRFAQIMANTFCLYHVDAGFSQMVDREKENQEEVCVELYQDVIDIMIAGLQDRKKHFREYYLPDTNKNRITLIKKD